MTHYDKMIAALLIELNNNKEGFVYTVNTTPYNQHESYVSKDGQKFYMFGYPTRKQLYDALHAVNFHNLSTRLLK